MIRFFLVVCFGSFCGSLCEENYDDVGNVTPKYNRELKHATFLSHGRKPERNISPARTVLSPRF